MKANGTGKLIAGGYNKATAIDADSVANRVLIELCAEVGDGMKG
jgi:hypothetical protein